MQLHLIKSEPAQYMKMSTGSAKKKRKKKQKGPAWTLPNEPEKKPSKE